jgi:hypothetical protein
MSHYRIVLGVLLLLCHFAPAVAAEPPAVEKQRITVASGVKVRATPSPSGQEVTRLFIGTALRELGRSERQEAVGGQTDYWYRVATPEGQEGWVFGSFIQPLEPAKRVQTLVELTKQRVADENAPFADRADLANVLKKAAAEAADKESAAQLELARWRAVRWALNAQLTGDAQKAHDAWVKRQGEDLVYSEPAGQWFVDSTVLWKLEEKYRGLPEAKAFAWEAATTPPPGECEGYAPCYLSVSNGMEGEYLKRYPTGPHAGEALKSLEQSLGSEGVAELDKEGKADLRKELSETEALLEKVEPAKKKKALEALKAMRKAAGR